MNIGNYFISIIDEVNMLNLLSIHRFYENSYYDLVKTCMRFIITILMVVRLMYILHVDNKEFIVQNVKMEILIKLTSIISFAYLIITFKKESKQQYCRCKIPPGREFV